MRIYYLLIILRNILLNNYCAQGSENVKVKKAQTHSPKTLQYLGKHTRATLVYCGKDYDRGSHKISWEHKGGMYI